MRSRTNEGLKHTKWGVEKGCARPRGRESTDAPLLCCSLVAPRVRRGCLGFELATIPRMTPESLKQPPRTTPCPAARDFIPRSPLTLHQFARFYAPLAATSLLLTLTNPLLTSALSRSVNPELTLAGFGVAFSLCGVLYSPLLVGQQVAATKLLSGLRFGPIQNFWLRIGGLCSLVAVAVAFTPVGEWVFGGVMGVSGDIFDEARAAIALLAPVPLLTAVRAVHQGRLVAGHRTNLIAVATGARTAVVALVAVVLTRSTPGGAWVGAAAFTTGLLVETILVAGARAGAEGASHPVAAEGVEPGATDDRLLRFSAPLMVNELLWWSTPVLINSVLARSPFPAEAIAAFVVVEGVAWFLAAPVGQYQHVSIGLVDCKHAHRTLQRWSYLLATAVALLIAAVSIPQVRRAALGAVFGLDAGLLTDIGAALPLAVAYPLLYGHRQYLPGTVHSERPPRCGRVGCRAPCRERSGGGCDGTRPPGTGWGNAWGAVRGRRARRRGRVPRTGFPEASVVDVAGVTSDAAGSAVGRRSQMRQRFRLNRRPGPRVVTSVIPLLVGLAAGAGGSMGHLAAAIELTWIVLVLESSVPTTATFFPANSLDLSWSLNR